jgi:hypothetical protein
MRSSSWRRFIGPTPGLVGGLLLHLYAQALAAFLVSTCSSFYPPWQSITCAQPLIEAVLGIAIFFGSLALLIKRLLSSS